MKQEILKILQLNKNKWIKGIDLIEHVLDSIWNYGLKYTYSQQAQYLKTPKLRKYIAELRLDGNIIIANQNGYMLTDNLDLIKKYLKSRWCELTKEMKPLKAMANAANMIDQLTIWEKEGE